MRFGAREYIPELGRWAQKDPSLFIDGLICMYMQKIARQIGQIRLDFKPVCQTELDTI